MDQQQAIQIRRQYYKRNITDSPKQNGDTTCTKPGHLFYDINKNAMRDYHNSLLAVYWNGILIACTQCYWSGPKGCESCGINHHQ